ncbi:MAG: mechanosensitive ion channel [Spirochaetales bacterium]|nr:mechanosensitive ion channel [Spirochaetales bacterium]
MFDTFVQFMTRKIAIGQTELFFSPLKVFVWVILPLIGLYIVYRLLALLAKTVVKRFHLLKEGDEQKKLYHFTRRILRILFFLGIGAIIINFLGEEISSYFTVFIKVLTTPFFESGSTRLSVVTLLLIIPLVVIGSWASKRLKAFLDNTVLSRLELDASTKFSISNLVRYIVLVLIILIELSIVGIDLSSLAVIFGVLGIGVGFGLQGIVANLFSGLVIFLERPIKEGDRIMIDGMEGTVVNIRLMSTIIDTLTNETIFIPNSKLMSNYIHNNSFASPKIIILNHISVAYGSDVDFTREILEKIGRENPYGLAQSDVEVRLLEFQDSGILMELRTWIRGADHKHQALSWANFEIARGFKENNISIPFPQRDLWVRNWPEKEIVIKQ